MLRLARIVDRWEVRSPSIVRSLRSAQLAILLAVMWLNWGISATHSNVWLLVPAAIASVITLVIVFTLEYAQNRDVGLIQLKLDQILRAVTYVPDELEEGWPVDGAIRIEERAPHVFDQDVD